MARPGELLNHEEVEFLLDAAQAATPKENTGTNDAQQVATMRGDLRQIQLADIFQTLGMSKMEGLLRVANALEQRQVHFQDGYVRILVPQRAATRRLGQRLVQAGVLHPDDLREILIAQGKERKPIGQLLVEAGHVTAEQVDDIVAQQITEELFGLFTWQHGEFEFYRGPVTDPVLLQQIENCPQFEINSLLLEVARRSDEWESILDVLGSLDEVPVRATEALPEHKELTSLHRAVLDAVDGRSTYRELGEQAMLPVFDCARAARDLFRHGCLIAATDQEMLGVARWHYKQGHPKQAMMILQTLRDRPGERPLTIVREIAQLLCASNENKAACAVLLEAAQLQTDPNTAIALATEARGFDTRDLSALSFLRTTLLAHMQPDAPQIEAITIELLDGLLADGDADRAMAIVEEMKQLERYSPAVMVREARAHAKRKRNAQAIEVLLLAAKGFEARGDKQSETEAYELANRLDRSRRDIAKVLRRKRMTPTKRLVRVLGYTSSLLLIAFAGLTWYESQELQRLLATATEEITALRDAGNFRDAHARIVHWRTTAGDNPLFDDLTALVRAAEATESTRRRKEAERLAIEQLQRAADLLRGGDFSGALAIYQQVGTVAAHRELAATAMKTRLEALQQDLDVIARHLPNQLPDEPSPMLERSQISSRLETLRRNSSPRLLRLAHAITDHHAGANQDPALPAAVADGLAAAARRALPSLQRAEELERNYELALARIDKQQQLDPLWKSALGLEGELRFAEALELYRKIHQAEGGKTDLRQHFAARIRQLEDIVATTSDIAAAAAAGDYLPARRAYDALRRRYPEIPFAQIVRLPVQIETSMPGARLRWNGVELATTPCIATYLPSIENVLELSLPGFETERLRLPDDHGGKVTLLLTLRPQLEVDLPALFDQPMAVDAQSIAYGADRSGDLFAIDLDTGAQVWRWHSGDTAGYLSGPLLHRRSILVASLDGPLRCLATATGKLLWQVPDLPTELSPRLLGDRLVVACTDRRLLLVDPSNGTVLQQRLLPRPPHGEIAASGETIVVPLEDGSLSAWSAGRLEPLWLGSPGAHGATLAAAPNGVVTVREDGLLGLLRWTDGKPLWSAGLPASPIGAPIVRNDSLMICVDDRALRFDLERGVEVWSAPRPQEGWLGGASFVGGKLALPARDGWVYIHGAESRAAAYRIAGDRRNVVLTVSPDGKVGLQRGRKLALFRSLP